jgi:hypothetical protein
MYLSIANHLGLHILEPLYKKPLPATLDLPVSMVVVRGAQAVGLGPHLSHLIHIYKSKTTKYMVQCPIHRNRKVVMHHQGLYESH